MKFLPVTPDVLLNRFGGKLQALVAPEGDVSPPESLIGLGTLATASENHLVFLSNPKLVGQLVSSKAKVVIVRDSQFDLLREKLSGQRSSQAPLWAWLVPDPYLMVAKVQQWWVAASRKAPNPGVHPRAVVDPLAVVHPSASIGPCAVVGPGCLIEAHAQVHAGAVIGSDVHIGEGTVIYPNVSIYDECVIGKRCIVHSGVVIGADGFGFAPNAGRWEKIPQVGRVVIGDDVEIGANTTIDRGAIDDTVIGNGVILDNQIMIAHNVTIGDSTAMAGCAAIAGSTKVGARCTIGGAAMINGHIQIVDGCHVSAGTFVMSSITEPGAYTGVFPAQPHRDWEKTAATMRQLTKLRAEVRSLKKQ